MTIIDCYPQSPVSPEEDFKSTLENRPAGRWEPQNENSCVSAWPMQDERGGYLILFRNEGEEIWLRVSTRQFMALGNIVYNFMMYGDPLQEEIPPQL
jgi:hypothetical protein